ncbi:MAG: ArsA family ATPase [Acidimicrobiales bacterium]
MTTPAPGTLIDRLGEARVVLVVGAGGVGKTTVAAAVAAAAAQAGRRVLVVTVDPARRLADALGVPLGHEPARVKLDTAPDGALWASMVEMARSWDELVERHAPNQAAADDLLANPLYRTLTRRFVQSHDYIALDRLHDLTDSDRYDLVVIDTPPSVHAIDVLDAPDRMLDFFDSWLLRWLTAPYRSRMAQLTARPFLAAAERVVGGPFLAQVGEFFWRFSQLQPGVAERARAVKRRLSDPSTRYLLITTADAGALSQADDLLRALNERHHPVAAVVHNRAVPGAGPAASAELSVDSVEAAPLRAAMLHLLADDDRPAELVERQPSPAPALVRLPWRPDLATPDDLADLITRTG